MNLENFSQQHFNPYIFNSQIQNLKVKFIQQKVSSFYINSISFQINFLNFIVV